MENKAQKKVLIIIGIILIIIAILAYVLSLFIDNNDVSENPNTGTNNSDITKEDEVTTDFTLLENERVFFGLNDIINHYLDSIMIEDTDELMIMLDEEYLTENNITTSNLYNYINHNYANAAYTPKEIYYNPNSDVTYYFIDGYVMNYTVSTTVFTPHVKFLVIVDESTNRYILRPINTDNLENYIESYNVKVRELTTGNALTTRTISEEEKITTYLSEFMNFLISEPEASYELLTDSKKREYGSVTNFESQVPDIYESLSSIVFSYASNEEENRTVYSVKDNKQNSITIYEYGIMNYQISF